MATTTVYAGSEDGYYLNSGAVWSTVRSGTTASYTKNSSSIDVQATKLGATYYVVRAGFPFDTSAIPDGDTISDATVYVKTRNVSPINSPTMDFVKFTPANFASIGNDDFDTFTYTSLGDFAPSAQSTFYNSALNDLTVVSKTGTTGIGILEAHDTDDSTPSAQYYAAFYGSEQTGTTDDPYITVTHASAASGPAHLKTWNGVAVANLKTINGISLANIKTINGVD